MNHRFITMEQLLLGLSNLQPRSKYFRGSIEKRISATFDVYNIKWYKNISLEPSELLNSFITFHRYVVN